MFSSGRIMREIDDQADYQAQKRGVGDGIPRPGPADNT